MPEYAGRRLQELQDRVEQHLLKLANVTAFMLETDSFHSWLQTGHPFSRRVVQAGTLLFNANQFSPESFGEQQISPGDLEACYTVGLHRAQEFLAGAQLYQLRREYGLSAFNLRQAVEQSLFTLLKLGTGYHCHIHSISRLMRYCALVTPALHGIFPRHTDHEKELFRLLQAAYVSSRYSPDFKLSFAQLQALHERTLKVIQLLQQEARRMLDRIPALG